MSGARRRSVRRALAVGAVLVLVVLAGCSSDGSDGATPTTVAPTTTAPPAPFDPDQATADLYAESLTSGLMTGSAAEGQLVVSPDQATCIAPKWIDAIGIDVLGAAEVSPDLLADPGYRYGPLGLRVDQAEAMLDAYDECGADLYGLFAVALAPDQPATVQACAVASVDHELARAALLAALTGADDLTARIDAVAAQVVAACDPGS